MVEALVAPAKTLPLFRRELVTVCRAYGLAADLAAAGLIAAPIIGGAALGVGGAAITGTFMPLCFAALSIIDVVLAALIILLGALLAAFLLKFSALLAQALSALAVEGAGPPAFGLGRGVYITSAELGATADKA